MDPRLLPFDTWYKARLRSDAPKDVADIFRGHTRPFVYLLRTPSNIPVPRFKLGRFVAWSGADRTHGHLTAEKIRDSFEILQVHDDQENLNERTKRLFRRKKQMSKMDEVVAKYENEVTASQNGQFYNDEGEELDAEEVESHVEATLKELEKLKKQTEDFQRKLKAGSLKTEDGFMSFMSVIIHGYDQTGPVGISFESND